MTSTNKESIGWHILDCFCDETGSCALTVFVAGERIHVIADVDSLRGGPEIWKTYDRLRKRHDDYVEQIYGSSRKTSSSTTDDSGVDVSADKTGETEDDEVVAATSVESPEDALASWMLQPLDSTINDILESKDQSKQTTVQEWYKCPTRFFELEISKDGESLAVVELEQWSDMTKRMHNILPEISLPKSLTQDETIRMLRAGDLTVISESDQPIGTAYHPSRVKIRGGSEDKTYFLKVVNKNQPEATKREIKMLTKIRDVELQKQINVPVLEGLVAFDDAEDTPSGRRRIMGFIQTDIPDATPLTQMFDPDIKQEKRERWAKDAERLKEALHKHGIVWGDAKADNFIVDKDDKLWIIDFGGSYTEGWVQPEIKETMEGDDMGTEKTVNALRDPVNNTCDPDLNQMQDEGKKDQEEHDDNREGRRSDRLKRKANAHHDDDGDDDDDEPRKKSENS